MSKVQKLMEMGKCKKDPIYAIQTYLETEDRTQGGYVKFQLFPRQQELVQSYQKYPHNIVMKPRQAGISTTTAAFLAILCALASKKSPEKILIAANKQETSKEFLKKIKDFINQLPKWMDVHRPPNSESWFSKAKDSSSHIILNNDCEIKAVASSKDALRGYTPSYIIIDEAAFIEGSRGEDFFTAAQPSLSTGGKSILISTPNGYDPLYHRTYTMAKKKDRGNNYHIVEMRWYEDPRYNKKLKWQMKVGEETKEMVAETDKNGKVIMDEAKWADLVQKGWKATSPWFEDMCAQLNHNERSIAQELLCSFLGSGDQVIDDEYVQRQKKEHMCDPIREEWMDKGMWIWEDPEKDHQYILAVDASSGSSDDFGGVTIWDFTTGYQVAEYHGKVSPDVLGEIAYHYGMEYDAFIVVDITGGWVDSVQNNKQIQKHMKNGKLPGLNFQKNRNTIVSELEKNIRMDGFKVRSIRSLLEMDTFVFINNRPDHQKGQHDDLLMCIAMCCYVGMTSFKDLEKSQGRAKAMLNSWATTTTTTEDVGSELDGVVGTAFFTDSTPKKDVQKITEEHMWLFGGMAGFKKGR
jgi:hypothetical protein